MKKTINKLILINKNKIRKKLYSKKLTNLSEDKFVSLIKIFIKYDLYNLLKILLENNFQIKIESKIIKIIFDTAFKYKRKNIINQLFLEDIENNYLERDSLYFSFSQIVKKHCIDNESNEMFNYILYENYYTKINFSLFYNYLATSYKDNNLYIFEKVMNHYIRLRKGGSIDVIFDNQNYFLKSIEEENISILNILLKEIDFNKNKKQILTACTLPFDNKNKNQKKIWDLIFNHEKTKNVFDFLIKEDRIFFKSQDLYDYYKTKKIRNNLKDF
jgi:hypothetical protein